MLNSAASLRDKSRKQSRAAERLISAAIDYCNADALAVAAQKQLAQLADLHDGHNEICCIAPGQTDFDSDPPRALPPSRWCEACRAYAKEAINGTRARWQRRTARQRMRRAYRQITAFRPTLADQIAELYQDGAIKALFRCREVESLLSGVFSDTEIREGLAALVDNPLSRPGEKRFKRVAKYRYQITLGRTEC